MALGVSRSLEGSFRCWAKHCRGSGKCCTRPIANCTRPIRNTCRSKKDRQTVPEKDEQDEISQRRGSEVKTVHVTGRKISPRLVLPPIADPTTKQQKALNKEKCEENEANLRKAAQYAGQWRRPDAEAPGTFAVEEDTAN